MYNELAGYSPPSAALVDATVDRSTSVRAVPFFNSRVEVGGVVMPATMPPFSMDPMNVDPAPAATPVNSLSFTPALAIKELTSALVEEPLLVKPTVLPLRSTMLAIALWLE